MMGKGSLIVYSVLLSLIAPLASAAQHLTLTGSSTIAPLALEIGKRFEQQNPGVRVDVQTGGSSRGVNDARTGLADIGMVSRALHESEADLTAYTIAMDGVCMILHRDNSIDALSRYGISTPGKFATGANSVEQTSR